MTVFEFTQAFPPRPQYKKGRMSLALVASDGNGGVIVIDRVGAALEWEIDEGCIPEHEAFSDAPAGISLWEGSHDGENLYGTYRDLTPEEFQRYYKEGSLWNNADWFEDDPVPPTSDA